MQPSRICWCWVEPTFKKWSSCSLLSDVVDMDLLEPGLFQGSFGFLLLLSWSNFHADQVALLCCSHLGLVVVVKGYLPQGKIHVSLHLLKLALGVPSLGNLLGQEGRVVLFSLEALVNLHDSYDVVCLLDGFLHYHSWTGLSCWKTIAQSSDLALDQILDTLRDLNLILVLLESVVLLLQVFDGVHGVSKLKSTNWLLLEQAWTYHELLSYCLDRC